MSKDLSPAKLFSRTTGTYDRLLLVQWRLWIVRESVWLSLEVSMFG